MGHADNRATAHPTAAAREPSALEGVKVREVAGVFRAREEIDKAVDALLLAGFDQSDIDLMATADAVKETRGGIYLSAEGRCWRPDCQADWIESSQGAGN